MNLKNLINEKFMHMKFINISEFMRRIINGD